MAWAYTNNPAGRYRTDIGEILCETAYAINEREHFMGRIETEWLGGLGSYPATTDLDGVNPASFRTLIAEMRGVIELKLILSNPTNYDIYSCDASWNHYTFATLYAEAMGAGVTWETATVDLAGHNPVDARLYEEMMKCVELIVRWEVNSYVRPGAGYDETDGYVITQDSASEATTGAAFADALADGLGPDANLKLYHRVSYRAIGDEYYNYEALGMVSKIHKPPTSVPYPTVNQARIQYRVADNLGPAATDDLDWSFRTITAAQFANPTWATQGTERDSDTFTGIEASPQYKTYATPAWCGDGIVYWRFQPDTACPFPADPNESRSTWWWYIEGVRIRQSYTGWTYN